ncbi:DUF2513 domain-containing protein [Pseudomonas graminis]|uniref:DUF2513 domain-containing protein n=1 Tax=Pseudomonas graminis TaxID=158627 RepID=UPI002348FF78|nr:DUF2513 domain-containing protein [Pseudomonas graminis]MDC6382794.1 DUF2513 domain-containing protein [Pseudomonas graminis]
MDLYRAIVLQLELEELPPGAIAEINVLGGDFPIEGYTEEQVHYHARQIIMAGLIDQGGGGSTTGFGFRSLTPAGHDFADSVRDEKIWKMTKDGAMKAGGFTVQLLVDLAKGFTKEQIQKFTDIEL